MRNGFDLPDFGQLLAGAVAIMLLFALVMALVGNEHCVDVTERVRVTGKASTPEGSGVCMPIISKIGNTYITNYIPVGGGVCVGMVEIIPARYIIALSNGHSMSVNQQEYDAAKVGDVQVIKRVSCDGK